MLFGFPFSETHCLKLNDDMVRLASANCGSVAGQTFTYDPFGNIDKSGSPNSFSPVYTNTRNRIYTVGSTTAQYDNNGNVLNDGVNTYTWDADGNSITVDAVGATFDALDRMVEQNRSSVYTEIVYAPTGAKLALMSGTTGQTLQNAFINLPGKATAVYTASGLDHYRHSDWLGSARLTSSPSRTVLSTTAYAPFGETYAQSGTADPSFTGQNSDTVSGEYDFLEREYSTQGRWPSPDPAGQVAVDPTTPQSWNRYAYVMNNPLGLTDPLGLFLGPCAYGEDGTPIWYCPDPGPPLPPPSPQPPPPCPPGMTCSSSTGTGGSGAPSKEDFCQAESDKSDAELAAANRAAKIAKQGLPSFDWAGTFAIGQALKIGISGGSAASVGWAALLGSAAKASWFFGKAVAVQGYHLGKSNFHLLTQTVEGCPGTIMDFSPPDGSPNPDY